MARRKHQRAANNDGELDMTPMIDIVFQLIIFFIVTIKMEETANPDIELEEARQGPTIKDSHPLTMTIEVDRRGWISINNCQLTPQRLQQMIQSRFNRYGTFPILIRADKQTRHADVRKVMDICTSVGLWRIDFAAIKEYANQ
jgi:biopolymer transport protein ExbD